MMEFIKLEFSIKDLENLSGIKAHTIRIWEQRYGLLAPTRSTTNIRSYSISDLQKILNVSLLNKNGYKISKLADLTADQIIKEANQLHNSKENGLNKYINKFTLAMVSFDLVLFEKTYNNCQSEFSFTEIFYKIFIPLLEKIGLLWQTDSINPTHEHFIANLVRQKLYSQIEKLQINDWSDDHLYVLFLPLNEIHDIGLLYIQYELLSRQKRTILLGSSIDVTDLKSIQDSNSTPMTFISYLTSYPSNKDLNGFLEDLVDLKKKNDRVILAGRKVHEMKKNSEIDFLLKLDDLDSLL